MKKILLFILCLNLNAYSLDYPGDTPPIDTDANWKDPTIPDDLNNQMPKIKIIKDSNLNNIDEKKLRKLKKALDILFSDDTSEDNKKHTEVETTMVAKHKANIEIKVNNDLKDNEKIRNTNTNDKIQITIK